MLVNVIFAARFGGAGVSPAPQDAPVLRHT